MTDWSRRDLLAGTVVGASAWPAIASAAGVSPRADFPIAGNGRAFLNSAYIAPVPRVVADAAARFAAAKAERPLDIGELFAACERVRSGFATLVNASPDEVGRLFSTAEGENIVAAGLDLRPGDNVVIDDLHYDTEFILYRQLERTKGIELRVARSHGGAVGVEQFAPLVDRRTRLISVAWVSHRNGFVHDMRPLADLAHAHGAFFYTDAIQAVGAIPVDVRAADVDALCAGGYKWLFAGWGVAPFYVKRERIGDLALDRYGEMNGDLAGDGPPRIADTARRFDYSSRAFGEAYALGSALDYISAIGVDGIAKHGIRLAGRLRREAAASGLRVLTPPDNASPIVAIAAPHDDETVRRAFDAAGIDVTVRRGVIRVAAALFNNDEDIDRCVEALRRLR